MEPNAPAPSLVQVMSSDVNVTDDWMAKLMEQQAKLIELQIVHAKKDREYRIRRDLANKFERPNLSSYPEVPSEPWQACRANFEAVASGQGLGHVLDTEYEPDKTDPQAVLSYKAECTFMLAVLKIVTAEGYVFRFVHDDADDELPCHIWEKIVAWEGRKLK